MEYLLRQKEMVHDIENNSVNYVVEGNSSSNNNSESKADKQETSDGQKRSFNKKVFSAEFMFFLFKVAEGILEPSIRMYLYDSVCLHLFADSDYNHICSNLSSDLDKEILVQETTATYMAHYKLLVNLPALVMVLCCGMWIDKGERITPIMFTCLGTSLACITFMFSSLKILWESPNLLLLLVGSGVRGAFGRSAIMTMTVNSYVSDYSSIQTRTTHLSNLIAMSNFGYLLGSSVSGNLLEKMDSSFVFMIITILNSICALIAYTLMSENKDAEHSNCEKEENSESRVDTNEVERLPLIKERPCRTTRYNSLSASEDIINSGPEVNKCNCEDDRPSTTIIECRQDQESLSQDLEEIISSHSVSNCVHAHDQDVADKHQNESDVPITAASRGNHAERAKMLNCFFMLVRKRPNKKRRVILALFLVLYIHQMNKSGEGDIYLLYVKRSPLSISKSTYGYLVSGSYASMGLFAFIVPKLLSLLNCQVRDSTLAVVGIVFKIGSLILLCFSGKVWMLTIVSFLTGAISLTVSSSRSLVSKIIETRELGRAFSLISSGETLCNFLGSLLYTSIYRATAHINPEVGFMVEACIYAILMLIMINISLQVTRFNLAIDNQESPRNTRELN